jgi:hypothetical protein
VSNQLSSAQKKTTPQPDRNAAGKSPKFIGEGELNRMKKLLMLMVAFTLVAGLASASTLQALCTSAGGGLGSNTLAAVAVMCPDFNPLTELPAGYFLNSVTVTGNDSFAGGLAGTNSWNFNYTGINSGFEVPGTGGGNQCAGSGSSTTCTDPVSGGVNGGNSYTFGGVQSSGLGTYEGSTNWSFATVSAALTSGAGTGVGTGGDVVAQATVTYDYELISTTPEPMSMMLVGGGLLGLGLLSSKLRKKA